MNADHAAERPSAHLFAGVSAALITLAAAAALALFSTDIAIGGDLAERAAIPLRMLALVTLATLLLLLGGETWSDVGLKRPRSLWQTFALVIVGYLAVGIAVTAVTQLLFPQLGIVPKTSAVFAAIRGNFVEYIYWLLPVAWLSAAVGEELVFRGFLQSRLERFFGGGWGAALFAVVAQGIIFGALHAYQGTGGAIVAGVTGTMIGLVYVVGGRNLWACILLHGLVDTISLTALYLGAAPGGS